MWGWYLTFKGKSAQLIRAGNLKALNKYFISDEKDSQRSVIRNKNSGHQKLQSKRPLAVGMIIKQFSEQVYKFVSLFYPFCLVWNIDFNGWIEFYLSKFKHLTITFLCHLYLSLQNTFNYTDYMCFYGIIFYEKYNYYLIDTSLWLNNMASLLTIDPSNCYLHV